MKDWIWEEAIVVAELAHREGGGGASSNEGDPNLEGFYLTVED